MQGFWRRLEETGHAFNPYQGAFAQQIVVAETDAEARREYERHVRYFFERCLHVYPGFADAPGYRTEATIRAGLRTQVGGGASPSALAMKLSWKELVDQGFIAAGSPASVTEQIDRLIRSLEVGHLVCLLHMGDMPADKCLASSRLFAEQVVPALRHHWREYEDRWSPRPLPDAQIATPRPIAPGRRQ
jgi:alkanesulfonate monooxygenase SsuD/methylene tetrahydromethanopterin reductase-like flavin-dependent oxidoreductase (luciferase family)